MMISARQATSCALLALATVATCSTRTDDFLAEAHDVMDATGALAASGTSLTERPRRGSMRTAVWQLAIAQSWAQYQVALRRNLRLYRERPPEGLDPIFGRTAPGDSYTLRVEKLSEGGALRLRSRCISD